MVITRVNKQSQWRTQIKLNYTVINGKQGGIKLKLKLNLRELWLYLCLHTS